MKRKWKEILLALFLGLIFPGLVFALVDKLDAKNLKVPDSSTVETVLNGPIEIAVLMADESIQNMELDDYITCVVLQEMPAGFENEALKAQAVVARTYTLRRYEKRSKHNNADICTDSSCCQAFCTPEAYLKSGGKKELIDKVSAAVRETSGKVLLYDGKLIEATYFSCSGGYTEDAKAVWGADIPYLQSTESPGEEKATHYVDTQTFTLEEFANRLQCRLTGEPKNWIEEVTYTQGGGVDTIYICGQEYKGTALRQKLGLRSTAFAITIVGTTVTITTKGNGHRVGMSQYGADAMALQGKTYPEILAHYYQDTQLVTYSGN